jgi:hypothetical protein
MLELVGLGLGDLPQDVLDEPVVQGAELQRAEHAPDLVGVPVPDPEVLQVGLHVHVAA